MITEGVGAKIAWALQSRQVFLDLKDLFRGYPLELIGFEEGEVQRNALLQAYSTAHAKNQLISQRFQEPRFLMGAVRQALASGSPDDKFDLLLQESERKGVYRSIRAAVAANADRLLAYDANSVLAAAQDGKQGILLDREETSSGAVVLELQSWQA